MVTDKGAIQKKQQGNGKGGHVTLISTVRSMVRGPLGKIPVTILTQDGTNLRGV